MLVFIPKHMNRWADGQMGEWASGRVSRWADGWVAEWVSELVGECVWVSVWVYEYWPVDGGSIVGVVEHLGREVLRSAAERLRRPPVRYVHLHNNHCHLYSVNYNCSLQLIISKIYHSEISLRSSIERIYFCIYMNNKI